MSKINLASSLHLESKIMFLKYHNNLVSRKGAMKGADFKYFFSFAGKGRESDIS